MKNYLKKLYNADVATTSTEYFYYYYYYYYDSVENVKAICSLPICYDPRAYTFNIQWLKEAI